MTQKQAVALFALVEKLQKQVDDLLERVDELEDQLEKSKDLYATFPETIRRISSNVHVLWYNQVD
jgi:peptidoglycan hydrolase CwlO-like protein